MKEETKIFPIPSDLSKPNKPEASPSLGLPRSLAGERGLGGELGITEASPFSLGEGSGMRLKPDKPEAVPPLERGRGEVGEVLNRVSSSSLITLDLEEFHSSGNRILFDIKEWLFQEQILKEKDFRALLKSHDWAQYKNKNVAIVCSADAIVPTWAYMLISIHLQPFVHKQVFGSLQDLETQLYLTALDQIDWQKFNHAKVVVKGCSKVEVPLAVYVEVSNRLTPLAASIMFGEPCSTVPLFKKKPI
jgi:hypothetical protein